MIGRDVGELMHTFPAFARSKSPDRLTHRYLAEDVAHGLAPVEAVGAAVGVQTPVLSAVVTAASCLLDTDLRANVRADATRVLRHWEVDRGPADGSARPRTE
jgi:hypothetical protein